MARSGAEAVKVFMVLGDGATYSPIEGCRAVVVPDHLTGEELDNAVKDAYDDQKGYFANKVKKGLIKGDLKIYNEDTIKIEFLGSIKDAFFFNY